MDLLSQYKQDHPEEFREKPQWESSREYGFFIRLVMRLSAGKIRDVSKAAYVLAIAAAAVFTFAVILFFFFSGSSSAGKARFSTVCFPVPCS